MRLSPFAPRARSRALTGIVPLLLSVAALGCGSRGGTSDGGGGQPPAGGDIVIAAAWPWKAYEAVLYRQGLAMALDEINRGGGIGGRPIRMLWEDDHESVDEGRAIAQRLAGDPNVVAVIGHLQSYVTVPAAAIYDLGGKVVISATATTPQLTAQGYKRVFRTVFSDRDVGRQLAAYATSRGHRRVAIYYVRTDYGRALANAFEEEASARSVSVVDRQSYDPESDAGSRGVEHVLNAWKALDVDAIFIAGQAPQATALIVQARKMGIQAAMFGGDALGTADLLAVGEAAEGTVVAAAFHPAIDRPEARAFTEAFTKRYRVPPDAGAALGYDALRVLAEGIRLAGSTEPERIAQALRSLRAWSGVTGPFSFDANGDLVGMPINKLTVRGGRFEYVSDATAVAQAGEGR